MPIRRTTKQPALQIAILAVFISHYFFISLYLSQIQHSRYSKELNAHPHLLREQTSPL